MTRVSWLECFDWSVSWLERFVWSVLTGLHRLSADSICKFHCASSIVWIPSCGFYRADSIAQIPSHQKPALTLAKLYPSDWHWRSINFSLHIPNSNRRHESSQKRSAFTYGAKGDKELKGGLKRLWVLLTRIPMTWWRLCYSFIAPTP